MVHLPSIPGVSRLPSLPRLSRPDMSGVAQLASLPGRIGLTELPPDVDVAGLMAATDRGINAGLLQLRRHRLGARPVALVTYRGWHSGGVAHMLGRCVEQPLPKVVGAGPTSWGSVLKANLGRFTVLHIPGVQLRASMGGASVEVTSDSEGYFHVELPVGELNPGWHVVRVEGIDQAAVTPATGVVLAPDPRARFAVVSDIDDTILKTGLTQMLTAATRTLLREVADRKPVPGMAMLYQGLERSVGTRASTPFFYVSTGSWNLHDYLAAFLELNHFPRGPMFLTDWGPTPDRLMRDGREHKRTTIRQLMAELPDYEFVLIGDVGQGDPETYELMAREHPGRIRAIFLIYVGSHLVERTEEVAARAERLRSEQGLPMYYVANAQQAVTHAWQLGLVDQATTAQIAAAFQGRVAAPRLR